ncbi:MAG TPA: sulfatase-like hydrolase/transferase, partial [Gemmatimonadaceae bacterium]|nr:sulfatase-like hydrolase/transferase [Gemmatimonadaceae bacterium]
SDMQQAFAGFAVYAISALSVLALALSFAVGRLRRIGGAEPQMRIRNVILRAAGLAAVFTAAIVLVFIEVLLFKDYGIHLYEFDVFGILADSALRRDLGIQPAEVLRVTLAAVALIGAELVLIAAAIPAAAWRDGAIARGAGMAMLIAVPGGLALFRTAEGGIGTDRSEFESALPLGRQMLLRAPSRPFIPVQPRLGRAGYPVLTPSDSAPMLASKPNIVFFVADGLRGDMFKAELTPNLVRFGQQEDVIVSRMHVSSGHVSEAGVFGLLYGLSGQAFHSFMEQRVPAFPLEVLRRNGYHTLMLASSRLSPYPSDQLLQGFDEVIYPKNDDDALILLQRYADERRADGRPYFVFAFFYTPHYPFTSAKPAFRKYPMVGPKARTNYMNDVLQVDDYFRQVRQVIQPELSTGNAVLLATSDHGEEIRDHGVFGHASATFWNEKIVVPMLLQLPGQSLNAVQKSPSLTAHADVWPTIFDYLRVDSVPTARVFDGRSLLRPASEPPVALVTGRFFPHADRPSVLVDSAMKYWFRVDGLGANGRLCIVVTRVTDIDDHPRRDAVDTDARMVPAFERLQSTFWRFIQPMGGGEHAGESGRAERRIC